MHVDRVTFQQDLYPLSNFSKKYYIIIFKVSFKVGLFPTFAFKGPSWKLLFWDLSQFQGKLLRCTLGFNSEKLKWKDEIADWFIRE